MSVFDVPKLTYQPPTNSQENSQLADEIAEYSGLRKPADEKVEKSETDELGIKIIQDINYKPEAMDVTEEIITIPPFVLNTDDLLENLSKYIDESIKDLKKSIKKYIKEETNHLDAKIVNIQRDVEHIKVFAMENRPFKDNEKIVTMDQISQIFDQTFPMDDYTKFVEFDAKIVDELYVTLKNYFTCNINTKETKTINVITIIFKDFFSRDLMKSFTAEKKSGCKPILSKTCFYKCFLAMMNAYNVEGNCNVTNVSLLTIIGSVINNSSDWDGFRLRRQRKRSISDSESGDNESQAIITNNFARNEESQFEVDSEAAEKES